ncbi:MAG: GNAT family N-acetyltransferase [Rubrobacter sp.]|nr:GNAT family N-acetyltransferase [Rubrobacter sp.]
MRQLRPHLSESEYLGRVRGMQASSGYRMAYAADGTVRGVAGFRVTEFLAYGRFLYVDDLVVDGGSRSGGYGKLLFDWLVERARSEGCGQLHLDSGVERHGAHRFYLREGMKISSHHFSLDL